VAIKADRTTNPVVYPDVGDQLVDMVSQQPEVAEAQPVAIRRAQGDDYRALVAQGLSKLEQLLRREIPPLSNFGFIPRPQGWNPEPGIFHDPSTSMQLRESAANILSNTRLHDLADDLVPESQSDSLNIQHFVPANFRALLFRPDVGAMHNDPVEFVQERSLLSLDELRAPLFNPSKADPARTSSALLQFRAKLDLLNKLAEWIQNGFAEQDYIELCKAKANIPC
jgi:hypothetical protein